MHPVWMRTAITLALLAAACRKAPEPVQPSPLRFESKSFEKIVPGCGDRAKREEPCVTFRINWVEVTGAPNPGVQTKINTAIRARLQPGDAPAGFEAEAAAVEAEFQRFHQEFPGSAIAYFVRRSAEVIWNDAHLLSVEIDEDDFKGGAHPNTHREYVNLAPATGERVALEDLLVPGGMAKLTLAAEKRFRAERQIDEGAKLSDAGFTFDGDRFALSRTWGARAEGLVIHYNDYEIAPHAVGPTTIVLPWSGIRTLIKKEAGLTPVH